MGGGAWGFLGGPPGRSGPELVTQTNGVFQHQKNARKPRCEKVNKQPNNLVGRDHAGDSG
eukprot:4113688-Prymnesium_polylepis.1